MLIRDPRYEQILRGDLGAAGPFLVDLENDQRRAEADAVRALMALAQDTTPCADDAGEITKDESDNELSALRARRALLELDVPALRTAIASFDGTELGRLYRTLWSGFAAALFSGACPLPEGHEAHYSDLHKKAHEVKSPTLVVDAATLRAVRRMVSGDLQAALVDIRRASRMAQAEHLWLPHYFASVFLARIRRLGGDPHLAVRIAHACAKRMPRVWWGWLDWELCCAGESGEGLESTSALGVGARRLREWTAAPTTPFPEDLPTRVGASIEHARDVEAARIAFDPTATTSDSGLADWMCGRTEGTPPHLHGFVAGTPERSGALVFAATGGGRRIAPRGLAASMPQLSPCREQPARVGTLLSVLLFAGEEGLPRAELFERTYGFSFRPSIHEPSFCVLRHYASSHVRNFAELITEGNRHRLLVRRPFALVDPRTVRPLRELMLSYLVRADGVSAKALSATLGTPLRTIQMELRNLVEEGTCQSARVGRKVLYEIEDTTFTPITVA